MIAAGQVALIPEVDIFLPEPFITFDDDLYSLEDYAAESDDITAYYDEADSNEITGYEEDGYDFVATDDQYFEITAADESISALWRSDPNQWRITMADENEITHFDPVSLSSAVYSMSSPSGSGGAAPPPSAPGGAGRGNDGKPGAGKNYSRAESFLSADELSRLSASELLYLERNIELGELLNRSFARSRYYPFPRDLTFPPEKPLFTTWATDRTNLVEIGVFEGASSLAFRRAMASNGTLHLIDPFVEIPDSTLVARSWMAKINLMRSGNGTVIWHRDYSYNIVKGWQESIDFLFIDGDHSERACRLDWDAWHQFVSVGGIVIFHDARFGKSEGKYWDGWPGPTKVADQLFRGPDKLPNWKIVDEDGTVVVVRRLF